VVTQQFEETHHLVRANGLQPHQMALGQHPVAKLGMEIEHEKEEALVHEHVVFILEQRGQVRALVLRGYLEHHLRHHILNKAMVVAVQHIHDEIHAPRPPKGANVAWGQLNV
jgi:hypothetical protein